jgi:hypothetical protein
MKRRLAFVAALLLSPAAVLGLSGTAAQAQTQYYVCLNNGNDVCLTNPGHGYAVYVSGGSTTTFTFTNLYVSGGHNYYLMRINGGVDCLNVSPVDHLVWDDSCVPGDSNELWWHPGDTLQNLGAGLNMTADISVSDLVYVAGGPANRNTNQWATIP